VNHAVRVCHENQYGQSILREVLLEFEFAIHRHQHLESPLGAAQKVAVPDPLPADTGDGGNFVVRQLRGEIDRQILVK